jgi:hypothetical protein
VILPHSPYSVIYLTVLFFCFVDGVFLDGERSFTYNTKHNKGLIINNMTKKILLKKIDREIKKVNKKIDFKISKGYSYKKEAKKHKELLLKMQNINNEANISFKLLKKKRSKVGKSPVRYSLKKGVVCRLFGQGFAC